MLQPFRGWPRFHLLQVQQVQWIHQDQKDPENQDGATMPNCGIAKGPLTAQNRMPPSIVHFFQCAWSGRRANLAVQGEVRVTVPNEQDSLRAGPTEQRLAWEEPDPLVRSEPTRRARDAAAWAEVCPATDFETGQLIGRVGTPENPMFTYEQVAHHRRGRDDFLLVVGADILTKERDHLSEATITELNKR